MKAILVIDIDEKYIGSIGTEIQFINQKYNCKWKLKPMPNDYPPYAKIRNQNLYTEEEFDAYEKGWNDCIEELEK